MKKQIVVSIVLCSLLILASCSIVVPSSAIKNSPDWYDGTFKGVWKKQKDETSGLLWGVLNQGRRATCGTFSGEWNTSTGVDAGVFHGSFFGFLVVLDWEISGAKKAVRGVGILRLNDTHFTAQLFIPGEGKLDILGVHDASFLPKITGPYGIGVKSIQLVDGNRLEKFTIDPVDVREIMMQIWYPIKTSLNGTHTEYMDYQTFQWLKGRSPIPLVTIPNNAYRFVRPHGWNNVNIATGLFPVVVFSPGYDGVYQIYTSFIEDLVSHGFVVASINHPYVSGITVFPDGRIIGLADVPTDPVARSEFFNMSLRTIVEDTKFVLDILEEMNATDPEFSGHFDLSHVGIYGHSFGGANTAVCCFEDHRFRAGLTLDGVFYQQFIPGDITAPFLFMFAESRLVNDSTISYMWNHTSNDTFKMSILGSTHYGFTDVGVLLSHLVPLIPPKLLSFGSITPKRMVNITRTYVIIFFEIFLKGEPLQTLLDLSSQFDEVILDYKEG